MEQHRPGRLKQKNKPHKAGKKRVRFHSTSSVNSLRSSSTCVGGKKGSGLARSVRKNQLIQIRRLKREEIINSRRKISIAPILIAVIDLSDRLDHFAKLLLAFDQTATVEISKHGHYWHIDIPKFRTRYQLVNLDRKDLYSSIDLAKLADILLIIHSNKVERFEVDNPELIQDDFFTLDAIYNHCLPLTIHAIIGLADVSNPKQKDRVRRTLFEAINKNFPGLMNGGNDKMRSLDTAQDLIKLFHYCSTVKCCRSRSRSYCSRRSQLLAEDFHFVPNSSDPEIGTLQVEGFVRNNPFNVSSLVYVPEFGEFQMDLIETVSVPYGDKKRKQNKEIEFRSQCDLQLRPSLKRENPVQTIFEEEMQAQHEDKKHSEIEKKKVPIGTSDYQANWIFESDEEENDDDDDVECDNESQFSDDQDEIIEKIKKIQFAPIDNASDDDDENVNGMKDDNEKDDVSLDKDIDYDQEINMQDEQMELEKFKEQRMYEMFPDEIDTPVDRPARERFAKYRGLKSFRTSQWDCKENLPSDYSRIFQFENFNRTRRRIFKSDTFGADPGFYIRVHLANVPRKLSDYFQQNSHKPLILYELLAHEHKMSVMNVVVKKVPSFTMPIKSKERLIFHVGYRRFVAKPIFSAHTTGDKHKYEKYLRSDVACVATLYGPITYPPAPVLVYKEFEQDGSHQLVAIGSLLDCSPDRLIIKRYILSGHPYKIHRRHSVVRYMFFNREDILWFRPVELRTKYGRHGHILEPLGTHGHMKCRFDHQLSSQDTVLMYLYKRVFPKWYYEPITIDQHPNIHLTSNDQINNNNDDDDDDHRMQM
ncbi:ribosome biogenesis protein tsr1 [Dermatophagoides farinae]|uniref:Pre-rRNA-processing protein TSR1 homolog n=1 Tax=Dermatophagoides farinae TaxID=6954 RepID=A0A922I1B2_DERFA|nr:ribosome biogenesis protein tsr1 [Dermatophagoides farinae]